MAAQARALDLGRWVAVVNFGGGISELAWFFFWFWRGWSWRAGGMVKLFCGHMPKELTYSKTLSRLIVLTRLSGILPGLDRAEPHQIRECKMLVPLLLLVA